MRRTAAGIVVPDKVETQQVRNGRGVLTNIMESIAEARDQGREPERVEISTALSDDLRAFFDYASEGFDGVLPKQVRGVRIVYVPGATKRVEIEFDKPVVGQG